MIARLFSSQFVLALLLTACVPYPHQMGLITEPTIQFGFLVGEAIPSSPKALFRTVTADKKILPNMFCFAPTMVDVVQGPIGSMLWMRKGAGDFEVEAILRYAISKEDLSIIRNFLDSNVTTPYLLLACPTQILRISPLAGKGLAQEVSYGYGRDGSSQDLFLIRIRGSSDQRNLFVRGLQSPTGILFSVNYRIAEQPDLHDAFLRLRSGTF